MSNADIVSIEVPIRIRSSHNISQRGFSSELTSHFSSRLPGEAICWEPHFAAEHVTALSMELSTITIGRPDDQGDQLLIVQFAVSQTEEAVDRFLQDLATGLSVSIAPGQKDGWHGMLFVDIPLAHVRFHRLPSPQPAISIGETIGLETISPQPVSTEILQGLQASPLAEIFVDGMKAPDPKAKFIYWFVMLEELERLDEFAPLFDRVFTPEQAQAVIDVASMTKVQAERFRGWANGRNLTEQGRPEKLARILDRIGIKKIETINGTVTVTTTLVRSLIEQRNKVAHRGSKIDASAVFTVLYPIAYHALIYLMEAKQRAP